MFFRRDQVLKICANHQLTAHMAVTLLAQSDRTMTWHANDYAEEEVRKARRLLET